MRIEIPVMVVTSTLFYSCILFIFNYLFCRSVSSTLESMIYSNIVPVGYLLSFPVLSKLTKFGAKSKFLLSYSIPNLLF